MRMYRDGNSWTAIDPADHPGPHRWEIEWKYRDPRDWDGREPTARARFRGAMANLVAIAETGAAKHRPDGWKADWELDFATLSVVVSSGASEDYETVGNLNLTATPPSWQWEDDADECLAKAVRA